MNVAMNPTKTLLLPGIKTLHSLFGQKRRLFYIVQKRPFRVSRKGFFVSGSGFPIFVVLRSHCWGMDVPLISSRRFQLILDRMAAELIEHHNDFSTAVLIGLQPRGIHLAHRLHQLLQQRYAIEQLREGQLDPTFYRDDFRRRAEPLIPNDQHIDFLIEDVNVILVDDVFYTGRTVRAALDALLDFGRPSRVELLALVDRKFSRQLPLSPDYVGLSVDTRISERVVVQWQETDGKDEVCLRADATRS